MSKGHRNRVQVEIPGTPEKYQPGGLPGWEMVGVVTDAEGTGALVKSEASGLYCRANDGRVRSLPQQKVLAAISAPAMGPVTGEAT